MAVKIRLQRFGKKKQPVYRVVVMDGRKPRDGRYIEAIGRYEPRQDPSLIEIDNDRALDWLMKGAQPTETAQKLLEVSGAWSRFKVAKGEIYTVGAKAAPTVEEADADADVTEADASETDASETDASETDVAEVVADAVADETIEPAVDESAEAEQAPAEPDAETGKDSE
ncbi:MAG: 30S ribosomal protein S16 [Acidimicrobiia bacterium]|nr:30S ribosomal protein S16 [Acidimicrobiia bacterium]